MLSMALQPLLSRARKQAVFVICALTLGCTATAFAQDADDYRGGWRTEKGEAHVYEFSIRDDKVRGIYCTYCADATTLAFIDGTLGAGGMTFTVTHVKADGTTARLEKQKARFDHGNLIVTGDKFERVVIKDPRGPDPAPTMISRLPKGPSLPPMSFNRPPGAGGGGGGGGGAPRPGYIQPGPWKSSLTEKDVIGVWLGYGVGAPKQYFIIKKVGNNLRGMVCGTCDNPYTMAALDDFEIQGDTLKFNILHEDWGDGEIPTFAKHVTAHIGWNELRFTTSTDHQPGIVQGTSLEGPIPIEATAGNRWTEWPPKGTTPPR